MKFTKATFREWFDDILFPVGFSWYKSMYYRIEGDVVQTISARMNLGGYIDFGFNFYPLSSKLFLFDKEICQEYSRSLRFSDMILSQNPDALEDLRVYDVKIRSLFEKYVVETLIPLLQTGLDANGAIASYLQYCTDRLHMNPRSYPLTREELLKFALITKSSELIYLSLKSKNFSLAEELLSMTQPEKSLEKLNQHIQNRIFEGVSESWLLPIYQPTIKNLRQLIEFQRRIKAKDERYFEDIFLNNEDAWHLYLSLLQKR